MAQVDIIPIRDLSMDSANADINASAQTSLGLGVGAGGKAGGVLRPLLEFDLAGAGIGAGATIDSAVLNLYVSSWVEDVTGGEAAATLYRLLRQDWEADGDVGGDGSYADWNHYIHDTDSWTTAGAGGIGNDYTGDGSVGFTMRNSEGWIQITVTALTQDALDDRGSLLDIILRRDNEILEGRNIIESRNSTGSGGTLKPFLDVDYTPAAGRRWGAVPSNELVPNDFGDDDRRMGAVPTDETVADDFGADDRRFGAVPSDEQVPNDLT